MTEKHSDDWRAQGKQVARAFAEGVGEIRDGITEQTAKHEDTIKSKLGKVTDFVDERTKHKYSERIDKVEDRLADGVGKVAEHGRESAHKRETQDRHSTDES